MALKAITESTPAAIRDPRIYYPKPLPAKKLSVEGNGLMVTAVLPANARTPVRSE
jgi:hypothetical protein